MRNARACLKALAPTWAMTAMRHIWRLLVEWIQRSEGINYHASEQSP